MAIVEKNKSYYRIGIGDKRYQRMVSMKNFPKF